MATEVRLPRLGQGMEAGTIVKWLKSEGEKVEKGEPLYELDTDKVTQEVEADASGVLLKIAVAEGEVEVGKTIAVIGEEGEDVAESVVADSTNGGRSSAEETDETEGPGGPARDEEPERAREASAPHEAPAVRQLDAAAGRVKASPLARRIARERGIELGGIAGTGPEGRVVAEDVERAAATAAPAPVAAPAAPPPAEVEIEQLSSMRKTIARRLTWSARSSCASASSRCTVTAPSRRSRIS